MKIFLHNNINVYFQRYSVNRNFLQLLLLLQIHLLARNVLETIKSRSEFRPDPIILNKSKTNSGPCPIHIK